MREREAHGRAGGMLCDDMGYVHMDCGMSVLVFILRTSLGKTIQTVVRIVDGPPTKEDRKKGWSRTTLQAPRHIS